MFESEDVETETSQSSCPAYEELLEVMESSTARLDLPWERTKMESPWGHLDERYLSGHNPPAQVSLPFWLRRNGKSRFPLAFIDSSTPVMLTS